MSRRQSCGLMMGASKNQLPKKKPEVRLVEVGPRDGLQNEPVNTSVEFRAELVNRLSACGLTTIEVGSFVSPKWVPQMRNTHEVFNRIDRSRSTTFVALVPNMFGMSAALKANVDEIAIFAAASETFSQKNTNCTIHESFQRFRPVMEAAKDQRIPVRGYVSCVLGCPYEGQIPVEQVVHVVERLFDIGCYEVSLGDTIGVGTVTGTHQLMKAISRIVTIDSIALHFHDTYGQALPNILTALEHGVSVFDSSIGGLGGCPYAKGASGNVATEDVIYMLHGMGIHTGLSLNSIVETSKFVSDHLGRPPKSHVATALM